MAAIIDSAPECVTKDVGTETERVDDSADFVLGNNYEDCAGFMTFGPGSTYGPEGEAAETAYMILTWLGIAVMVAVLVSWMAWEHRHLIAYAAHRLPGGRGARNRT